MDDLEGVGVSVVNADLLDRQLVLDDLAQLERLGTMVHRTSLCGLGQSAPNPVMSTLRYFADEYKAHIEEKRCPAGACGSQVREEAS